MRLTKALASHLIAFLPLIFTWGTVVLAQSPPAGGAATVLVIDGSGSMWGELGAERSSKLELTQGAVRQSLEKIGATSRFGLVSFGHRRRADCNDVEVMAPLESGPPERIVTLTDKLNPRGKGPLSLALREGAKLVPAGTPATVVLVHDGPDNCSQDPCAAAADIAKDNPGVAVHVISLGLDKADAQRMACVPRLTKGQHYEVADKAALEKALEVTLELVSLDPGGTGGADAAIKPPDQARPGLRLTASLSPSSPPLTVPVRWTVTNAGSKTVVLERAVSSAVFDVPPGIYDVVASYGLARASSTLEVTDTGPTVARLSLEAGTLKLTARANKNGEALAEPVITVSRLDDEAQTQKLGEPVMIGRASDEEIVLPKGRFGVRVEDGLLHHEAVAVIEPGKIALVDVNFGAGLLEVNAVGPEGGTLTDVLFAISEDDPDAPQGRREVARSADPAPTFRLPVGTYYLLARHGAAEKRDQIAIGSGNVVKHTISFEIARLKVATVLDPSLGGGNGPVTVRVFKADEPQRELARSTLPEPEFLLPPQRYMVEAQAGDENVRANVAVDLVSGRDARVSLRLDVAELTVSPGGAGQRGGMRWRVKDARGRTVLHSGAGGARTARLAPGRYVVQSDDDRGVTELPLDLQAGERRTVELAQR